MESNIFLLVIFAEVLPKTYSINRPTRTALFISPIIYYLNKILSPLVFIIKSLVVALKKYPKHNLQILFLIKIT